MCMQGRCNNDPNAHTVAIVVTDSCPECEPDHLDLQVSSICQIRHLCCHLKMLGILSCKLRKGCVAICVLALQPLIAQCLQVVTVLCPM